VGPRGEVPKGDKFSAFLTLNFEFPEKEIYIKIVCVLRFKMHKMLLVINVMIK
jgi:hypothetical protein